jgi:hypothetical protein
MKKQSKISLKTKYLDPVVVALSDSRQLMAKTTDRAAAGDQDHASRRQPAAKHADDG